MLDGFISGHSLGYSPRHGALGLRRWQAAIEHAVKTAAHFLAGDTCIGNAVRSARPLSIEQLEARQLLSATYFVSPSGSDSNPGTLAAPFKTIQHAASIASSGSVVNIETGTYHETVTPAQSGITFQAYEGENVVIDGADPVTGFTKYSGSIYKANAGGSLGEGNNQVFVNGQLVNEAIFPNNLSLSHPTLARVQSGTRGSLTDSAIGAFGVNWVGGLIHICAGQEWVAQTATITGQSGNTIDFNLGPNTDPHFTVDAGNGFYLFGKFAALKSAGQWFIDSSGNLYLWAPGGGVPTGVEVKHRQYGFNLNGKSNIVINGINLFACSIDGQGSSGVKINGIHDTYVSQYQTATDGWHPTITSGINITGNNNSISNSVIAYSAGDGIFMSGHGNTITNNIIHDVDYEAFDNAAIRVSGSGVTISNNTIYNCARDGIKWSGTTDSQVTGNLVHDVMLQTTDGGAIYEYGTNGTGSVLAYNEIYNVHCGGWGGAGLYLDNNSSHYYVHNNDVFNVDIALKMNPTSLDERIIDNTLLATEQSVGSYGSEDMSGSVFEDDVFNNILEIKGSVQMIGIVHSGNTSGVKAAGASISA